MGVLNAYTKTYNVYSRVNLRRRTPEPRKAVSRMKSKHVKCKKCGGIPEILDNEGPYCVECVNCGEYVGPHALKREAWQAWKRANSEDTEPEGGND